jgi:three-Cys-motif partner protein
MGETFFDEQADQSAVKTAIVTKYFSAWATIMCAQRRNKADKRIAYVDVFAGPGRYKDGTISTPLLILENAISKPELRDNLVTMFNDKDEENARALMDEINKLDGIKTLRHRPSVNNDEVGEEMVKRFEDINLIPTLFFVDPWGYKGLSLRLINSVLKDWGCECIFFFNYNRINPGLANASVKEHMDALFGELRAEQLRARLDPLSPAERELTIVEEISEALSEGDKYVLPFEFKNDRGTRTKHHLIFVSKHPLGYKIMKGIMAKESSNNDQGVPSFDYTPATEKQPLLFELNRPLDDLADILLEEFAEQTISMNEVFEKHNYGRRYIERNYKDALSKLEMDGKIIGNPPFNKRIRNGEVTCGPNTSFVFPGK